MPTLVKLELVTPVPNCVALKTFVPFILKDFPVAMSRCSLDVQESVLSTQLNVLSVVPFNVRPPPSARTSLGEDVFANTIFLSSIVR